MHSEPSSPRPLISGILSRFKEDVGCVSLDLSRCDIGDELFPGVSDILSNGLKSLNLSHNKIGLLGIQELARLLEGNTTLEELNLSTNHTKSYSHLIGSADDLLIGLLASNICLKILDLSWNIIHPTAYTALLEGLLKNEASALINLKLSSTSHSAPYSEISAI